ncbi:MAG TPA: hypothetical protein VMU02_08840, partial [bacterium]|nr:hypothetical protein [bacterium]
LYAGRGEQDLAIHMYEQATKALPFVPEYWSHLAQALEDVGQTERAVDAWKRVVELGEKYPSAGDGARVARQHLDALGQRQP